VRNRDSLDNEALTSQSLSFASTFLQLSINVCELTHEEKIIEIFHDDSIESMSDVGKSCENANLSNETHAHTDERNTIDNDAMISQSLLNENLVDKRRVDTCVVESENTMQSNMDDTEDIENTALHVDENIDAGRLFCRD